MSVDADRLSTPRALWRLLPFVRPALPRLIIGIFAGLVAGLVALAIPQVLQVLVDSALSEGDAGAELTVVRVVAKDGGTLGTEEGAGVVTSVDGVRWTPIRVPRP